MLLLLPPQRALAETLRVNRASLVAGGAPRVVPFHKNAAAERVAHLYCATHEVARAPCALLEERIRLRQQAHNAGSMLAQHRAHEAVAAAAAAAEEAVAAAAAEARERREREAVRQQSLPPLPQPHPQPMLTSSAFRRAGQQQQQQQQQQQRQQQQQQQQQQPGQLQRAGGGGSAPGSSGGAGGGWLRRGLAVIAGVRLSLPVAAAAAGGGGAAAAGAAGAGGRQPARGGWIELGSEAQHVPPQQPSIAQPPRSPGGERDDRSRFAQL